MRSLRVLLLLLAWTWPTATRQTPAQAPSESTGTRWSVPTERVPAGDGSLYHLRADDRAIYWVTCTGFNDPCVLYRLGHDAAAEASSPTVLASVVGLRAYAIDANDVFFADGGRILRVPKRGGPPVRVASVPSPVFEMAVFGDSLYASVADTRDMTGRNPTARPGKILKIPKAGGAAVELGEHNSSMPRLAIDRRTLFFTGNRAILSMPIGGGPLTILAQDDSHPPSSLAIDAGAVYYSAGGEVRRVAKTGGRVEVLYRGMIMLDVRASGGAIYAARNQAYASGEVAQKAALVRIPTRGGDPAVLTELSDSPQSLAVDGSGLFAILRGREVNGREPTRIMAFPAQ